MTAELRQRNEFDGGAEESKRELESEGRRCGSDRGSLGFMYGPGERRRGGNDR
jgi:hypothetical protein